MIGSPHGAQLVAPAKFLECWLFAAAALLAAAFLHLRSPNIPDADSFYHIGHAALYATRGPLLAEFPWIASSAVAVQASDLWYGFHLLLLPFAAIDAPATGIKLAGILLTFLLLLSVRQALIGLRIPNPSFWPFLLLVAGPNVLYHFSMTRPHVLTAGLSALLFASLVTRRAAGVFLVSLAIAFFHLSQVWVIVLIVLVVIPVRAWLERHIGWRDALAALAGSVAGLLLRPNPLGGAKLAYLQIVEHSLTRAEGVALTVGKELVPITWRLIGMHFVPMLILWAGAAVLGGVAWPKRQDASGLEPRTKTVLVSSLVLSAVFFALMLLVARRAYDLWSLFAVVFVAAVSGILPAPMRVRVFYGTVALFTLMAAHAIYRNQQSLNHAHPPDDTRETAEWIEQHGRPGEIVYNVCWDSFPTLFVWNQSQRYVSGMDPIFLHAYDPALYYESLVLQYGKATSQTCRSARCTPGERVDTYTALVRDFGASWLFVEKERTPELYAWVKKDARFIPGFENAHQAVFRISRDP